MKILKFGVYFEYHGDSVYYLYPWHRPKFWARFYSTSFDAHFGSLKELRKTMDDYFNSERIK